MGSGTERLPRLNQLRDPRARMECLERFANHELMAVELFAWALLAFPELPSALRRGFLRVLEEEQIHLGLYLQRLRELRASLSPGDSTGPPFESVPLGNYFWRQVPALRTSPHGPRAFLAAMGLTFEQANLDYSLLYRDAFRDAGDEATARVIERVHRDEIGHVRLAAVWLRRLAAERREDPGRNDVALYVEAVPFPLSAARAKGRRFDVESRRRAGLSEEMIAFVRAAVPYDRRRDGSTASSEPKDGSSSGVVELFANLGAEEDSGTPSASAWEGERPPLRNHRESSTLRDPDSSVLQDRPESSGLRDHPASPVRAWSSSVTRNAEAVSVIWLLATGLAGTARVFLPGAARRKSGSPENRLHPAFREWLATQSQPSPILALLNAVVGFGESGALLPWLSTDAALQRARREHLRYLAPSPWMVREIHDKAFAVRVGAPLWNDSVSDLITVFDPAELRDAAHATERIESLVATWPAPLRKSFTLKPRLGTSGRGRVRGEAGTLPPSSLRALARLADRGGAVLEPWFDRMHDFSVQLLVRSEDEIDLLGSTEQIVARSGLCLGNRGILRASSPSHTWQARPESRTIEANTLSREQECASGHREEARLVEAAFTVARAAASHGFFGPCGVDSFSYRSLDGSERIRPVVEFNARITTGTLALTAVRAALEISGQTDAGHWEFRLSGARDDTNEQGPTADLPPFSWRVTLPLLVDGANGPIVRLG